MYQNEAMKTKGNKIVWSTHPKAELLTLTRNQPPGRRRSCNIVLDTPGPIQEAVRPIHSEVDACFIQMKYYRLLLRTLMQVSNAFLTRLLIKS